MSQATDGMCILCSQKTLDLYPSGICSECTERQIRENKEVRMNRERLGYVPIAGGFQYAPFGIEMEEGH
jgi:hypothetical protein